MDDWESRIERFWDGVERSTPEQALEEMRALVAERPANDPAAAYESASIQDYLGYEAKAIPLYEAALSAGLDGDRRPQAVIQLASSYRNFGRPDEAVQLLSAEDATDVTGDAAQAFLALALHSEGSPNEALRVALRALARTLPRYERSVTSYADAIPADTEA